MNKKAFTLIEVMIVVAIIGILFATIAPQVMRWYDNPSSQKSTVTAPNVRGK